MKQKWHELAGRFDALTRRERAIVALAVLLLGGWFGYLWAVDPALLRQAAAVKRSAQATQNMGTIETQLVVLQARVKNPDAGLRTAIEEARTRTTALDAKLAGLQESMVSPEKMPAFLESLLAKHRNLELLGLQTLPPITLGDHGEDKKTSTGTAATTEAAANIYKHGVEIRIAGSYSDLLTYLTELERMPQRVIWNRVKIAADHYPRNIMTLTVYTLSLDKQWLVL
jgi:MSHA biogenesis protein MshJ